jgi:hypothetical protein
VDLESHQQEFLQSSAVFKSFGTSRMRGVGGNQNIGSNDFPKMILKCKSLLTSSSSIVQDCIAELVVGRVQGLLESIVLIDWFNAPPASTQAVKGLEQASEYVSDVIQYLQVTFSMILSLPKTKREAIHFTSCMAISNGLKDVVCGENNRVFSALGYYRLQLDVKAFEHFANTCVVESLSECFTPLSQLLEAVLYMEQPGVWGLPSIMDSPGLLNEIFPQVDNNMLIIALKKFKEPSLGRKNLWGARQAAADASSVNSQVPTISKKQLDQVLKKL